VHQKTIQRNTQRVLAAFDEQSDGVYHWK